LHHSSVSFPLGTASVVGERVGRREIRFDLDGRPLVLTAAADLEDLLLTDRDIEQPPYWAVVWPAGVALAAHLKSQRDLVGKVTLELGCGAGLPGIVARRRGARVLQTDLFPEAVALARWNARRNGAGSIRHLAMDWRHWSLRGRFDLILASDVLYDRALHTPLAAILETNLAERGEAWLADPGRPLALEFAARLESAGWSVAIDPLLGEVPLFMYRCRRPPLSQERGMP
jgi:predicted nicotinamide N-methyase